MSGAAPGNRRRLSALVTVLLVAGLLAPAGVSTPAVAQTTNTGLCDTAETTQFSDVEASDYAAAYILCMRALGLSVGFGDGNYGADLELNRAQMASFLVRLWKDQLGQQCPTGTVSPFTDIAGNTHEANINCLYGLGITKGTTATTYGPQQPLKASQISRFLYRTYRKAPTGSDQCPTGTGPELDQAVACLLSLRVAPTEAEAISSTPVIRSQMAVYMIGLWHNLTGKGVPPKPPNQGNYRIAYWIPQEALIYNISYLVTPQWSPDGNRIAFTTRHVGVWTINADGTNPHKLTDTGLSPQWSPDGNRILYVDGDNSDQVWAVATDGSDQRQLSANGWEPLWSPDGTQIAYTASIDGDVSNYAIWVMGADGSNPRQLSRGSWNPVWSPDGTRIAYESGSHIWVMDADGSNPRQLSVSCWDPVWSPDSSRIACWTGEGAIWVVGADGSDPRQLGLNLNGRSPVWSPDGARIAYTETYEGDSGTERRRVRVVDADGSNPKRITQDYGDGPAWSPDGSRIAYVSGVYGAEHDLISTEIWVASADGSNPEQVVAGTGLANNTAGIWVIDADGSNGQQLDAEGWGSAWSQDGTRIAYSGGGRSIWVMDADGSNRQQLTTGGGVEPEWSPDGTRIAYRASDPDTLASSGVAVIDDDGTNLAHLTESGLFPRWSPDGKQIAFYTINDDFSYTGVWVVDANGSNLKRLSATGGLPVWSPDGRQIAYSDSGTIWVMGADGSNPQDLGATGGFPVWSPDGKRIAHWNSDGIWIMSADGSNRKQLTTDGVGPVWSPDGLRIAFATRDANNWTGIWVVNADGANLKQLTTEGGFPVWSPVRLQNVRG